MSWRLAKSLQRLLAQVNARWPSRSKESDGALGDTSHQARPSDHNPDGAGVVHALDITHDPACGLDSYVLADRILGAQDPRLKYVISNRRIGSGPSGPSPGVWRPYNGANPHNHHVHVSVVSNGSLADNTQDWLIDMASIPDHGYVPPPTTLRPGSIGDDVGRIALKLGCKSVLVYAKGSELEWAIRLFQSRNGLDPDGIVGPMTWAKIDA